MAQIKKLQVGGTAEKTTPPVQTPEKKKTFNYKGMEIPIEGFKEGLAKRIQNEANQNIDGWFDEGTQRSHLETSLKNMLGKFDINPNDAVSELNSYQTNLSNPQKNIIGSFGTIFSPTQSQQNFDVILGKSAKNYLDEVYEANKGVSTAPTTSNIQYHQFLAPEYRISEKKYSGDVKLFGSEWKFKKPEERLRLAREAMLDQLSESNVADFSNPNLNITGYKKGDTEAFKTLKNSGVFAKDIELLKNTSLNEDQLQGIADKYGWNVRQLIKGNETEGTTTTPTTALGQTESGLVSQGYKLSTNLKLNNYFTPRGAKVYEKDGDIVPITTEGSLYNEGTSDNPNWIVSTERQGGKDIYRNAFIKNAGGQGYTFGDYNTLGANTATADISNSLYQGFINAAKSISGRAFNPQGEHSEVIEKVMSKNSPEILSQFKSKENPFNYVDLSSNYKLSPGMSLVQPAATRDEFGEFVGQKYLLSHTTGQLIPVDITTDENGKDIAKSLTHGSTYQTGLGNYFPQGSPLASPSNLNIHSYDIGKNIPTGIAGQTQHINLSAEDTNKAKTMSSQELHKYFSDIINGNYFYNEGENQEKVKEIVATARKNRLGLLKLPPELIQKMRGKLGEILKTSKVHRVSGITAQNTSDNIGRQRRLASTNPTYHKKGGEIIKADLGALLAYKKNMQSPNIQSSSVKLKNIQKKSGDQRFNDEWTGADWADNLGTLADLGSLAGGGIGVASGLAGAGLHLASDVSKDGLDWGDMGNLGLNLGFAALAFIPGLAAAKGVKAGTKVAGKAVELAMNASKVGEVVKSTKSLAETKRIMDAAKVIAKTANGAKDSKTVAKLISNPKIASTLATLGNNGLVKLGSTALKGTAVVEGGIGAFGIGKDVYNSGGDFGNIKVGDIKKLAFGVGGVKSMYQNSLLKAGTQAIKNEVETAENITKGISGEIKIAKSPDKTFKLTNNHLNEGDALKEIKATYKQKAIDLGENTEEGKKWLKAAEEVQLKDKNLFNKATGAVSDAAKKQADKTKSGVKELWNSSEQRELKTNPEGWWQNKGVKYAETQGYSNNKSKLDQLREDLIGPTKQYEAKIARDEPKIQDNWNTRKDKYDVNSDLYKAWRKKLNPLLLKKDPTYKDVLEKYNDKAFLSHPTSFKEGGIMKFQTPATTITKKPNGLVTSKDEDYKTAWTTSLPGYNPQNATFKGNSDKSTYISSIKDPAKKIAILKKMAELANKGEVDINGKPINNDYIGQNPWEIEQYKGITKQIDWKDLGNGRYRYVGSTPSTTANTVTSTPTINQPKVETPKDQTNLNTGTNSDIDFLNGQTVNPLSKWGKVKKGLSNIDLRDVGAGAVAFDTYNTNNKIARERAASLANIPMGSTIHRNSAIHTDLASENAYRQAATDYMGAANRMANNQSDLNLSYAAKFEGMNKGYDKMLEGKLANTAMFNKTKDEAIKTANEDYVANIATADNNQKQIFAQRTGLADIEAKRLSANLGNRTNLTNALIGNYGERSQYNQINQQQQELKDAYKQYSDKAKDWKSKFNYDANENIVVDPKTDPIYKRMEDYNKATINPSEKRSWSAGNKEYDEWMEGIKTRQKAMNAELTPLQEKIQDFRNFREQVNPYAFGNYQSTPYQRNWTPVRASGGKLTNAQKVELTNIKLDQKQQDKLDKMREKAKNSIEKDQQKSLKKSDKTWNKTIKKLLS